jgi:hypothetical protein
VTTDHKPEPTPEPGLDFTYERADLGSAATRIFALLSLGLVTIFSVGVLISTWVLFLRFVTPDRDPIVALGVI